MIAPVLGDLRPLGRRPAQAGRCRGQSRDWYLALRGRELKSRSIGKAHTIVRAALAPTIICEFASRSCEIMECRSWDRSGRWGAQPLSARWARDIISGMTDILIRDVPDEVLAAVDANAQRVGLTRAEYLRRVLAEQQGPAVTREQLNRFVERTADLGDPEVMAAAWR